MSPSMTPLRRTDAATFVTTSVLPALGVTDHSLQARTSPSGAGVAVIIDTINSHRFGYRHRAPCAVSLMTDPNSAVVSSSRIRAALQDGEPERAADMLGHDWAVTGIVQRGDQRGRTIGFPTANIPLGDLLHPAFGVYAVQIFGAEPGQPRRLIGNGVANIGVRPTVEDRGVLCEAHVFDQQPDLYGKRLAVCLKAFIRAERKFTGIDELTAQIAKDARDRVQILPPIRQTA